MWDGKIPTAFTLAEDENTQVGIHCVHNCCSRWFDLRHIMGGFIARHRLIFSQKLCSTLAFQILIVIFALKTSIPLYLNATSVNVKKIIPTFGEELDKLTRVI